MQIQAPVIVHLSPWRQVTGRVLALIVLIVLAVPLLYGIWKHRSEAPPGIRAPARQQEPPPASRASLPLEIKRLQFFESGSEVPSTSLRQYDVRFPKSTARRINFQVEVANREPNTAHTHKVLSYYSNPDSGRRQTPVRDWVINPAEATAVFTDGVSGGDIGGWSAGMYHVEVVIDGQHRIEEQFAIYEDTVIRPRPAEESPAPDSCTVWQTAPSACANGFMREYYEEMNKRNVSAILARWENPSEGLQRGLAEGLKTLQAFVIQDIQISQRDIYATLVEVHVTEMYTTRKPTKEWFVKFELCQANNSPFAPSGSNCLNFKLPVESRPQAQPL